MYAFLFVSSRNASRGTGNRRPGSGSAGRIADSTSVDSVTHEVDDLLGLLAAMEEGLEDAESGPASAKSTQNKSGR